MTISSASDLAGMRAVGRLVAATLAEMEGAVRPGITTGALDKIAERFAVSAGARSAPRLAYRFPGFTCISVNDQIVHGVPGPRVLAAGDVVKLDVTLELGGYIADSARTVIVPPASFQAKRLRRCARAALNRALNAARAGRELRDIGGAIEGEARRCGFAVVRELCGHGIGRRIHEEPSVPNYAASGDRSILADGLVIAVEPMIVPSPARPVEEADGWTLRTHTGVLAVHQEHTIVIRGGHPEVLT